MSINSIKRNSKFIRNVGTIFGGVAVARAMSLLAAPIVARLFDPEDFGVAALFVTLVVLLAPISTLQYERAIVLPREEIRAFCLIKLAVAILGVFCAGLFVTVICLGFSSLHFSWITTLGAWIYGLPPAVALFGVGKILNSWYVRNKQFRMLAAMEVIQVIGMVGTRIGAGVLTGSSITGLIFGYLVGVLCRAGVLLKKFPITALRRSDRYPALSLRLIAKEYKEFPAYVTSSSLVRILSESLPVLLLAHLFSPTVVGFYALTNRLVKGPAAIAQKSVGETYFQKAAEIAQQGRSIHSSLAKTTSALLVMGFPFCVVLMMFGEEVFALLMGSRWTAAGRYAEILAPWFLTLLLVSPASSVHSVVKKQGLLFRIDIAILIGRGGVFAAAYMLGLDPPQTLYLFMAISVIGDLAVIVQGFVITRHGSS